MDQIFNLKFTSKQLVRAAKKCEKEEKDEKLKIKKAIEKGAQEAGRCEALRGMPPLLAARRLQGHGGCGSPMLRARSGGATQHSARYSACRGQGSGTERRRPAASPRASHASPCRQHGRRQDLRAERDPQEERGAQLPAAGQQAGRGCVAPGPAGQDAGAVGAAGWVPPPSLPLQRRCSADADADADAVAMQRLLPLLQALAFIVAVAAIMLPLPELPLCCCCVLRAAQRRRPPLRNLPRQACLPPTMSPAPRVCGSQTSRWPAASNKLSPPSPRTCLPDHQQVDGGDCQEPGLRPQGQQPGEGGVHDGSGERLQGTDLRQGQCCRG